MALQIKRKFIENAAIDGDKLKLSTGQAVKLVKQDGTTVVNLIELDESTGKIKLGGAVAALKSDVDSEAAARQAGDAAISGTVQSLVGAEADRRYADDQALSGRIAVFEGPTGSVQSALTDAKAYTDQKVSDLVNSAPAVLDTLKELSDALGSDPNFATTVANNIGSVQSELDATQAGAGLAANGAYSAPAVSNFLSGASNLKDADSKLDSAIKAEETRAKGIESGLQSAVDTLNGADSVAGSVAKAVKDEATARSSADSAIQSELDATQAGAGLAANGAYVAPAVSSYLSAASNLKDADSKLDAAIKSVSDAVSALSGGGSGSIGSVSADLAQEIAARQAGDTNTLNSAKAYTDQKVADLVNGAPAMLDTLKELADAITADESAASALATTVGSIQSELDATQAGAGLSAAGAYAVPAGSYFLSGASNLKDADSKLDSAIKAEETRAKGIESGLQSAIDVLAAKVHKKQKFVLSGTDLSNGYVDLDFIAMDKSIVAAIGRLMIHEGIGEDFTVSTVNNDTQTRISFTGNLVSPNAEQLAEGDVLYVKYVKA